MTNSALKKMENRVADILRRRCRFRYPMAAWLLAVAIALSALTAAGQQNNISVSIGANCSTDPPYCGFVVPGSSFTRQVTVIYNGTQSGGDVLNASFGVSGGMHFTAPLTSNPPSATAPCRNITPDLVECDSSQPYQPGAAFVFTLPLSLDGSPQFETSSIAVNVFSGKFSGNTSVRDSFSFVNGTPPPAGTPDLVVEKEHDLIEGSRVTYRLHVKNIGNAPTNGPIHLKDTFPSGISIDTSDLSRECQFDAFSRTLTFDTNFDLSPNADYVIIVHGKLDAVDGTVLKNQATVSGGGETNTANNDSKTDTLTVGSAQLQVTKLYLSAGQLGKGWLITVKNRGKQPTNGPVTVTDKIPSGVIIASFSDLPGGRCSLSGSTVTCQSDSPLGAAGSKSPADSVTFFIPIAQVSDGTIVNTATATADGAEGGISFLDVHDFKDGQVVRRGTPIPDPAVQSTSGKHR